MSSHHFVREGQEPALLILDVISWEIIGPLLEWAPLVIVVEASVEAALRWGIKIDAVITAGEQLAHLEDLLAGHGPVKILPQTTDPFTTSLSHLVQTHQSAINIITSDPFPIIDTVTRHAPPLGGISIITPLHRWSLFQSGSYTKWHPAHATIQIYQSGTSEQITTPTDGLITLTRNPPFWIAETL
jgi:hypothetical protein